MKNMKKVGAILLALVVAFAMTTIAFAAGTGSITVDNAGATDTYTAYKILDVKYNADKTAYAYTISNTSPWFATVNNYAGLTLTATANDATLFVVEKNDAFSAAEFAKVLKEAGITEGAIALENDGNGTATATGLDLGYYFVTTTMGALCNLTTTDADAVIHDKNDVPFEKTADDTSVELGQVVTYTIDGKVPDTTGFTTYEYVVADTMSKGLTFNKDVTVTVDGVALDSQYYTIDYTTANSFTLDIDVMNIQANVTDAIVVTYSATVNADAIAVVSTNEATLTYSNDPTTATTTTSEPEIVEVYSAKIAIDKYDSENEETKLAGAKFVLLNADGKFYNNDGTKVTWVDSIDEATVYTTDALGVASFEGLEDGTYALRETEAPEGYNLLTEDKEVIINGADATVADASTLTVGAGVANSTGTVLPSTGGMGLTLIYVVGAILVLGAAVMFITKKRAFVA